MRKKRANACRLLNIFYDVGINNATFDVQAERLRLISEAVAEDSVEVQKQLVAGWQEKIRKVPVAIKQCIDEDKMEQDHIEENYFEILQRVVNERRQSMGAGIMPNVCPKVDPRDGAGVDDSICRQRQSLLLRLADGDRARIEKEVEQKWSDHCSATENTCVCLFTFAAS